MYSLKAHWNYFKCLIVHKYYVFIECYKFNIPIIGILHDLDKFLPYNWITCIRYFYNKDGSVKHISINNDCEIINNFNKIISMHFNKSKHHWQKWTYRDSNYETQCVKIPNKFLKEMIADWKASFRSEHIDARSWYLKNYDKIYLHYETRLEIDNYFDIKNKIIDNEIIYPI